MKRLDHFVRFLDAAALMNGEEINFEAVASDAGVPARTVASYFEVLQDTLIAFLVPPFAKTRKRKAIKRSKLYFFDVGVVGALAKRSAIEAGSELFGRAFEHFIAQELRAFLSYKRPDFEVAYWRSLSKHEVDFVLADQVAIEVKATDRASERHLVGLRALMEENVVKRHVLVSNDPIRRKVDGIEIVPWTDFLDELWHGEWV